MKLANIAVVSAILLGSLVIGCKKEDDTTDSGDTLGSTESQLVEDDSEASDTDDDVEAGVDEPLSGATPDDPGTPADGTTDDELGEKARTNPGRWFKAGCINSSRNGLNIKHVFAHCTGPYGMVDFNGEVNVTFAREPGKLTITYTADGFTINGAKISGSRVVVFTKNGTVITKTRTGHWTGTTAKGKDITHDANFVTTWDSATKCITREGSAQSTIGGRSFERVITDYKRCGIGRLGCPESGTITISRTKSSETLTLKIEFLGGRAYRVTRPNGKVVERQLLCNPNAK
jgi:hypothetical protein